MSFNYRCTRPQCRTRKTLRHEMEWYIRKPKCPACKYPSLAFDGAVRRQTLNRTCRCRGIRWPHRRGTVLNEHEFCNAQPFEAVRNHLINKLGFDPDTGEYIHENEYKH